MKNLIKFCLVAIMILLPFSCDQDSSDIANSGVENFNKSVNNKVTVDDVIDIPASDFVTGDIVFRIGSSATLLRNKNGITANFNATGLTPGAYTMWFIVFNNPSACDGPCEGSDLGTPAVYGDVLYAAGHVVGDNGNGVFSAHLSVGDISGSLFGPDAPGLKDPQSAEIHLVIRSHGEAIPGEIKEQIHTIDGSCDTNFCDDILAAIFVAP